MDHWAAAAKSVTDASSPVKNYPPRNLMAYTRRAYSWRPQMRHTYYIYTTLCPQKNKNFFTIISVRTDEIS